jgi:hypothetical protein
MLHACVERFDVMGVRRNILGWDGEVNEAQIKLTGIVKEKYYCNAFRSLHSAPRAGSDAIFFAK